MQVDFDPITSSHDWLLQVSTRRRVTQAQYRAFCEANPDLRIERSAEGELIVTAPAHSRSGNQNIALSAQLYDWAKQDGSGVAFDSSTGFDLPDGANLSPDSAWVLKSRIEALRPDQREEYMDICPDFVVELRSSSDRLPKLQAKMQEYVACGAKLAWLIDPLERRVWIYQPGKEVERLDEPSTVTAGPLMPGFILDLDSIWNPQI